VPSSPAVTPRASSDLPAGLRALITRYFFAATAAVCAICGVLFLALPAGLGDGVRLAVVGGFGLLVLTSLLAMRAAETHMPAALGVVSLLALLQICATSVALQWGLHSVGMGFIGVLICLVGAVGTQRVGLLVGGTAVLGVSSLAWAEHQGWLPGAAAASGQASLMLRLIIQLLTMGMGLAGGLLLARALREQVRVSSERELRFVGLLRIAADAYWEMDAQDRLVRLWQRNAAGDGFMTSTRRLGRTPWDLQQLDFDDADRLQLQADLKAQRPFHDVPACWKRRDGSQRHLRLSGEPRHNALGAYQGFWGVVRDDTEEREARQRLAATELNYRELFQRTPLPMLLHRGGHLIDANSAAVALFGLQDATAWHERDFVQAIFGHDPAELARVRERVAALEKLPAGATLPHRELQVRLHDGRLRTLRVSGVRVTRDGSLATLAMYVDDTERRETEEAERRSQALLTHLINNSPDIITLTDSTTHRYLMVNRRFETVYGLRNDEVVGRTLKEMGVRINPESRQRLSALLREHGGYANEPLDSFTRSGERLHLLASAASFVVEGRPYVVTNSRDITAEARTRQEHEAMLHNAAVGICFVRDDRFLQVNPRCEQLFGWPRGAMAGQPASVVCQDETSHAELLREIEPLIASGQPVALERELFRHDRSRFLCQMSVRAVNPLDPVGGGSVWILEDITARRQTAQALARARDDAEAANRAKSAFLANTSHEIRTPLNGLLGLLQLLRQPGLAPDLQRRYIEQMADSAQALSAIISDILDVSKIEAGKLHIETVPFDLRALLATLHQAYGTLADVRGLSLQLAIGHDVPEHVLGDPVRLRQILGNYLANALKFTAQGRLRLVVRAPTEGLLRFEVHDTGAGIAAEAQAQLFRPFTQADQSTTRRHGGTGLGLSICHQLAALMGGSVGVISQPGRGSCFWAELPLPGTQPQPQNSGFGGLAEADALAGARVLMVEDNPVNMLIASALLSQWGVQVTEAIDGRQAIEAVQQAAADGQPFQAVLMDVQMPEMSGHEVTRVLRRSHSPQALPIIALTAAALVSERDEALQAGMNDFLTKPIDADRLRQSLGKALATSRAG
jgi:PAS domain S-box-containing protein